MPDTRVRVHLPVTVRVRGTPAPDQLNAATVATALAVRRAVAQARERARDVGWELTPGPQARVAVRVPPTEAATPDNPLLSIVDSAVREGVRLGTAQALSDLGLRPSGRDGWAPRVAPTPPGAEDPPMLAIFTTYADVAAGAAQFYPDLAQLLPRGRQLTGVYGVWAADMKPRVFWVTGQVAAGLERGQLVWNSIILVNGKLQGDQWVATSAGNEPAALQPGDRYRLYGSPPPRKAARRSTRLPPEPTAYTQPEGGGLRRRTYLSRGAVDLIRDRFVRFGVPFGEPTEPKAPPTPPPTPPAADVRYRRETIWWLLHKPNYLSAESLGEPEWLWEWFGYLNVLPAEVRANPSVRNAIAYLARRYGREAILDMDLIPGVTGTNLLVWRRRFLIAFCLYVALAMLAESRARMEEFRAVIAQLEWRGRFATFLRSLTGWATTVNRYRRIERRLREADQIERDLRADPDTTESMVSVAMELLVPDREVLRQQLATIAPPTEEEEFLTLAAEHQPLLVLLTVHEGRSELTLAEELAEAVDRDAPLTPDDLARTMERDLQWLIDKTREAEARLAAEPEEAYQLRVVQEEAVQQLKPWFDAVASAKESFDRLIDKDLFTLVGLSLGLLVLAFVFPPLAGAIAVAGFALGTYTAAESLSRALRLNKLSKARLAQAGFRPLVSQEELDSAILTATLDIFFAVLDLGPSARAIAGGTRAVARHAAGALGLRLEQSLARARTVTAWPQRLQNTVWDRLREAAERQRLAGAALAEPEQLASELYEAAQLNMLARYEQHLAGVRGRLGEALETGELTADNLRALQEWLTRQRLSPDEFFAELIENRQFFEEVVARQARGEVAAAAARVGFLPAQAELTAIAEELGPLAHLLGPPRVFAFREATGLTGLTYRDLAETLGRILRRVDAPVNALAELEQVLARRPEAAAAVLDALGNLPNPQAAVDALTPELLEAAGREAGAANLIRAIGEAPRTGDVVERVAVAAEREQAGQLVRAVRRSDGTRRVQRWQRATGTWEPAPRRLLPEDEPVPRPGEPVRAPEEPQRVREEPARGPEAEEPPRGPEPEEPPIEEPPIEPPLAAGAAAPVHPPRRGFRAVLDSVVISAEDTARYRSAYRRYVRRRGDSRSLRRLDDYARYRHGLETGQFTRADIQAAFRSRDWGSFYSALDRVPAESIPPADLARLRAEFQQRLAGPWRDEQPRMLSEDEWVRWQYGREQGRIQPAEGPPVPLGQRVEQLAGHELQRVVNGRLPAGSANSREYRVFGAPDTCRPDHLPPGTQVWFLDSAGRFHPQAGPGRTPFSARFVGDSKYLETVVPFDRQTEAFVRLARRTDESSVVFYVRWRDSFPAPSQLAAGPLGVGFELPAAARSGVVSGNLLDFAAGGRPLVRVRIVSDPNWR